MNCHFSLFKYKNMFLFLLITIWCTSEKLLPLNLADFEHKHLFFLVSKKWIFSTNGPFAFSLLLKVKLFLLIISESIHRTKNVVKQKMSHYQKTKHIDLH